jgi:4-hydroxy-3-methylbut-2-enyl diphosphate reductase
MDILLSSPRGFCAGVVRAIEIVERAIARYGPPIYVKHEIVHNPYVVHSLEQKGAVTVENVQDIPDGSTVIFSAHGSPPEDFALAREHNMNIIDATCPLVTRVHNEAKKYSKEGRKIILVGHKGHIEVRGTMGQVSDAVLVDEQNGEFIPKWDKNTPVTVLTQTTLSVNDTANTIENIKNSLPSAIIRNDICYATTNRQEAVKRLAAKVDLVLVIGAQNSSNCNRLREVAEARGVTAYLINSVKELDSSWLEGINKVGIASGASTPEILLDQVIRKLEPKSIETLTSIEEDVTFVLPDELK